ncbi:QacE family quaternary ammonium compound efflux SMR transporter [Halalkalibacillus sediminis]|uniref:QacE family quaternary ammonium compound efflux SMR transporter n=1 Tax=Halalkalibacillus sediminis TaxID=2018042 RepID=A0A2I0QSG3_9BACI|nr:SMR family transporter [Halalkalibacillus sediminis]PKR77248.1 QacE family quaternary ammonium compound efflux SMR transporter [Halalkalibacillus sediminis]
MHWIALIFAGVFEIIGILSINWLHLKKNFSSFLIMVSGFTISFALLSYSMTELSMSVAYSIWTGIGASGSAIIGMLFFNEKATFLRILFIFIIISATMGLKIID